MSGGRGSTSDTGPRRAGVVLGILLALVSVAIAFRFVAEGTFQADDYNLTGTVVDPMAPHAVRLGDVFAEFVRPWSESGDRPFFRPFFVLAQALCVAVVGVDATALHVVNLLFHLLATALVGWLGVRIARSAFAGMIGALLFGLHPMAVEPVAWIASFNEVLADTLVLGCLAAHLRSADGDARGARVVAVVLAMLALLTKESAWVLPVWLIGIDVLGTTSLGFRERTKRVWPFVAVCAIALSWRWLALGRLGLGRLAHYVHDLQGDLLGNLPTKVVECLAPWDWHAADAASWSSFALLPAVAMGGVIVLGLRRRDGLRLAALAVMFVAALAPGFTNLVQDNGSGSRVLYPALVVTGLAIGLLGSRASQRMRVVVGVALLAMVIAHVRVGQRNVAVYRSTFAAQRAIESSLAALRGVVTPDRPATLLVAPTLPGAAPSYMPTLAHRIATRPWSDLDVPMLGATFVFLPIPDLEAVHGDASIPRALAEWGSALLTWDGALAITRVPMPSLPAQAVLDAGRWTADAAPLSTLAFEMVEVVTAQPIARGEVVLTGAATERIECVAHAVPAAERSTALLDVSRHDKTLLLGLLGALRDLQVHAFDAEGREVEVRAARLLPRVPEILHAPRLNGVVVRGAPTLVAPQVDGVAPLRIVVCGAGVAVTQSVTAGARVAWEPAALRLIDTVSRSEASGVLCYFFDRDGVVPGRSTVDSWRVR